MTRSRLRLGLAMTTAIATGCGRFGFDSDPSPDATSERVRVVQQATAYLPAPAATLAAQLPTVPAAGHVLVMVGGTPAAALTSVAGGGATWVRAVKSTTHANIEIWVGVADGSDAPVTIMSTGATGEIGMAVSEWEGLATTATIDTAIGNSGTASPAAPGQITTIGPRLVLLAAGSFLPNTFGAPMPDTWTALAGTQGGTLQQQSWFRVSPIGGTFAPVVSETQHRWDAAVAALMLAPAP